MQKLNHKYIYTIPGGYKVDIRKSKTRASKVFTIRCYESCELALIFAMEWRDLKYLELFDHNLTSNQRYGIPRNGKLYVEIEGKVFKLTSGLHCERINGFPTYFTLSTKNKKKRFSIKKLGLEIAYKKAISEV